jgi:hypothetical protein
MQSPVDENDAKGDEDRAGPKQRHRAGLFLCPVDVVNLLWKLPRGKSAPNQLRRDSGTRVEKQESRGKGVMPSPVSAAPGFFRLISG